MICSSILFVIVSSIVLADPLAARAADLNAPAEWYAAGQQAVTEAQRLTGNAGHAKNVILFVGDGMGIATITAARILEGQMHGGSGEENFLSFEKLPYLAAAVDILVSNANRDNRPRPGMSASIHFVK